MYAKPMAALRRISLAAMVVAAAALTGAGVTEAAEDKPPLPQTDWSFSPPFGTYDRAQLQRGFQIYRNSCAACHSANLLSFRNLSQPGGPEFTEAQVKALAAEFEVEDGPDESGDMFFRPGKPSDRYPAPFPNDNAARAANNGALPPDLSLIAKSRKGGPDYLVGLLLGYVDPPEGQEPRDGMYYNPYFSGGQIAMPQPLDDGYVTYTDGTPETVEQYARDVAAFLMWSAEPKLEERHRIGFQVVIYLIVLAGLLYATKRKLFASVEH